MVEMVENSINCGRECRAEKNGPSVTVFRHIFLVQMRIERTLAAAVVAHFPDGAVFGCEHAYSCIC